MAEMTTNVIALEIATAQGALTSAKIKHNNIQFNDVEECVQMYKDDMYKDDMYNTSIDISYG